MMTDELALYCQQQVSQHRLAQPLATSMPEIVLALADAAKQIARLAAQNGIGGASLGQLVGASNADGDAQKQLDLQADDLIAAALSKAGAGSYFSEERAEAVPLTQTGRIGVACDPLDGSSNIDTNLTIGTIFALFDMQDCQSALPPKGRKQLAAGLFVYGPQTALLLSFGDEVAAFALSESGVFARLEWDVAIARTSPEFAINASNAAFWPRPIQRYIHERSFGAAAAGSGMRWLGSLVADAFRIFRRGGVFLYPQDSRKGYETGRLRLIYEANPIAFLVQAAGGRSTDGYQDILDIPPTSLHQRTALIFGSTEVVEDIVTHIKNNA